jgi:carbon-monoxide dehydrogenase large subunit
VNAPERALIAGSHVGSPVVRFEDARFLTGRGLFTDDVRFEGMAHAALLRSPHANARIRGMDLSSARDMPGVLLVAGAAEIGEQRSLIPLRLAPLPGLDRFLQYPIAADRVRFVGEPVALVVAESRYLAEDALDAIQVDYEPLDPVTSTEQALRVERLVHEAVGSNIGSHYSVARGDPDAGFAKAQYRRKERFRCHRHTAAPMETRGLVAHYDGAALRVWGATKVPFFNRRVLAKMLALPESSIEMIETDIGGGFGVRGEFYPEDFLVPWAAMQLRRPVKWIEDRREHLLATNHARETECELEIGLRRDGTIVAMRATVLGDLGAYARTGGGVAVSRIAQFLPGPYRIADYACEVYALLTNKTPVGTYRGPGRYEANFFRERLLDLAAADLGLDPVALREHNLVSAREMPYDIGALVPYEKGADAYDAGDFHSAFRQALAAARHASLPRDGALIEGRLHGLGVACFTESSGAGPAESARLVARADGLYDIYSGVTTMGQGHETVFAQIAADELGAAPAAFRVFHGSTSHVEQGWGTYHSRAVVVGGSAVKLAAQSMREKLIALAARRSGLPQAELVLRAGAVSRSGGTVLLEVAELARAAAGGDAEAQDATHVKARFDVTARNYSYGAHVAHVAVDPQTAQVQVLSYVAVEDVGRVINPLLAEGQAVGGAAQGIGATFLDELVYDETGQLLTGSFADYLLPTSTETPPIHAIFLEETPSTANPLRAKGAGEGGIVATGAALANAVANALGPLGVKLTALPLSLNNLAARIRTARQEK